MIVKRFKLEERTTKKFFWVYVYDTVASMRHGALRFNLSCGKEIENLDDTLAITHPYQRIVVSTDGTLTVRKKNCGIIRFAQPYLTYEVIAHEVFHAAIHNAMSVLRYYYYRTD